MQTETINVSSIAPAPSVVATGKPATGASVSGIQNNGLFSILLGAIQAAQSTEPQEPRSNFHGQQYADGGNGIADRDVSDRSRASGAASEDTPMQGADSSRPDRSEAAYVRDGMDVREQAGQSESTQGTEDVPVYGSAVPNGPADPAAPAATGQEAAQPAVPAQATVVTQSAAAPDAAQGSAGQDLPATPEQFGTQTQRVTGGAPAQQPQAAPEAALDALAQAGKDASASAGAARPMQTPSDSAPAGSQTAGSQVAALALEGSAGGSEQGGVQSGLPQTAQGYPAAEPSAQPSPAPAGASANPATVEAQPYAAPTAQSAANGVDALVASAQAAAGESAAKAGAADSASGPAQAGPQAVDAVFGTRGAESARSSQAVAAPEARSGAPRANQQQVVERIASSIRLSREQGTSRVRIVLRPPQLGTLKVNLAIRDGVLTASLQTETAAARHLIAGSLHELRAALAQHGIDVDSFEVIYRDDSSPSGFERQTGGQFGESAAGDGAAGLAQSDEPADEPYDPQAEKQRLMAATATVDIFA